MKITPIQPSTSAASNITRYFLFIIILLVDVLSSQDGAASSETSGRVVKVVIAVIKPDFNSLAKSEQISFRDMVTFFVRKGAHFTEYMILGVLLFLFYYEWRQKIFQVPQKENTHIMQLRLRRIWFMAWITGTLYAAAALMLLWSADTVLYHCRLLK